MNLRDRAQKVARDSFIFEGVVEVITEDLEIAASKYETLTYQKGTAEDELFNFVKANQSYFEEEGLTIDSDETTIYISWV
ncbi:hypothetical protein LIX87_02595 [Weissella viridescens]|uniref:hypothetical protein n=1 Tax=Weissella viridescens TaxID=1629 RepID=UPI001D092ADC|nr:hypothetical protein [Weissella viridescens]MCB6839910.1 hypothetical protein [Weissella viridescens]MCB6846642.1 hypothetical protein [Weissella viridescens]